MANIFARSFFMFSCMGVSERVGLMCRKPHHHQLHTNHEHNAQTTNEPTNNNNHRCLRYRRNFRFWVKFYTEIHSKTHTWHCCGPCLVGDVVLGLDFFTVATGTADVATFSLWIFCWFALFTLLLLTLLLLLLLLFVFAVMAFRWLMLFITILLVVVVVVVGLLLLMLTFAVRLPLVATVTARAHRHHENSSRDRER